ncbi:hypothetical protein KIN20_018579 [Parelaphostrongylus tenuis]|uniref:Uncharacterized protein n=1 Tax=Parelaphostrongylus tenuis TaxID=148309 RepID=A0AAD5MQ15_PARTN|nr:hypothetical protein KIN20_018579 [Parelaphostrongylus tenuis]
MGPKHDDEHGEFNLTKKNSDSLHSNELTALFTLLALLLVASLAYIVIKTMINSRRGISIISTQSPTVYRKS